MLLLTDTGNGCFCYLRMLLCALLCVFFCIYVEILCSTLAECVVPSRRLFRFSIFFFLAKLLSKEVVLMDAHPVCAMLAQRLFLSNLRYLPIKWECSDNSLCRLHSLDPFGDRCWLQIHPGFFLLRVMCLYTLHILPGGCMSYDYLEVLHTFYIIIVFVGTIFFWSCLKSFLLYQSFKL